MTNAIELLRKAADRCQHQAKKSADSDIKAELFDMTARWHWLAGETARLYDRAKQLETV
jgi:hypothetical protein